MKWTADKSLVMGEMVGVFNGRKEAFMERMAGV